MSAAVNKPTAGLTRVLEYYCCAHGNKIIKQSCLQRV